MASVPQRFGTGRLCTLFRLGAIGDLSDRQLLERFLAGDGELAELAFTALVERHGPMVLRACTALLRDPHDAQDVFQATFLVLLRKARGLWVEDSLGPWLHRVAARTAARAQAKARRRRQYERRAAESRDAVVTRPHHDGAGSILHEEIDALPERLRVLVVLCHLEGQSQELAAKTLSLPVGTVKSRLHRARELLRRRLERRGVGPAAGLAAARPALGSADALRSLPLCESLVRAAARSSIHRAGDSGLVSVRAIHLFKETINAMFLTKIRIGVAVVLLAGCLATGAAGVFAQQDDPGRGAGRAAASRGGRGKSASAVPPTASGGAPAYVRQSRTMIIERLEARAKAARAAACRSHRQASLAAKRSGCGASAQDD